MPLTTGATEVVINDFLARATIPCPAHQSSKECPICTDEYGALHPTHEHMIMDPETPEHPVKINIPNSPCHHVFGRRCLEQHLRSGLESWNKCPICRQSWFEIWNPYERELHYREITILEGSFLVPRNVVWYASKFDQYMMGFMPRPPVGDGSGGHLAGFF